jgi:hypothetical protein
VYIFSILLSTFYSSYKSLIILVSIEWKGENILKTIKVLICIFQIPNQTKKSKNQTFVQLFLVRGAGQLLDELWRDGLGLRFGGLCGPDCL